MRVLPALIAAAVGATALPAEQAPALSTREMFSLVTESPARFEREWERFYQAATDGATGEALAELRSR